jgi:hypothetical protein
MQMSKSPIISGYVSLEDEYVGDVTIPTQVFKQEFSSSRSANQIAVFPSN